MIFALQHVHISPPFHLQLETVGLHLRTSGDLADRAAAYDSESRIPGDIVHVAALVARASHAGGAWIVLESNQISGHVLVGQQ